MAEKLEKIMRSKNMLMTDILQIETVCKVKSMVVEVLLGFSVLLSGRFLLTIYADDDDAWKNKTILDC